MSTFPVDPSMASTPAPPYYAVIFTSRRTPADDAGYAAAAARLQELCVDRPGFLGMESARTSDGLGLTVSYWESLEAIRQWRDDAEHRIVQGRGREDWYSEYRLRVARVVRDSMYPGAKEPQAASFAGLVASRKSWIADELRPWCRRARRADLLLAEQEWLDIAGKADPGKTLWAWAWERFPALVHEDLGLDESAEVELTLADGRVVQGFPDARKSAQGKLMLYGELGEGRRGDLGPFSIDDIRSAARAAGGL